jgi:hypothetical protein
MARSVLVGSRRLGFWLRERHPQDQYNYTRDSHDEECLRQHWPADELRGQCSGKQATHTTDQGARFGYSFS